VGSERGRSPERAATGETRRKWSFGGTTIEPQGSTLSGGSELAVDRQELNQIAGPLLADDMATAATPA
jgi:hypothetical protein